MNAKLKKPATKKTVAKKPAAKSAPKKPIGNRIDFHEVASPDLFGWDADEHGGEIGWDLDPSVIKLMPGNLLHVHQNPTEPSHMCFRMRKHPDEAHMVLLTAAHELAGVNCETWIHTPQHKNYLGMSRYSPSELSKVVKAVEVGSAKSSSGFELGAHAYQLNGETCFTSLRAASEAIDATLEWMSCSGSVVEVPVRDHELKACVMTPVNSTVDLRQLELEEVTHSEDEICLYAHLQSMLETTGQVRFACRSRPRHSRADVREAQVCAAAFALLNDRLRIEQRDVDFAAEVLTHKLKR